MLSLRFLTQSLPGQVTRSPPDEQPSAAPLLQPLLPPSLPHPSFRPHPSLARANPRPAAAEEECKAEFKPLVQLEEVEVKSGEEEEAALFDA